MADSTRAFTRLLAPPDHTRTCDVPNWLVPSKLQDGWKVDPNPDTRFEISDALPGKHKGRPALVCGCGPSMGMADVLTLAQFRAKHNPVVYATNHVWQICGRGKLPLPKADYLVILDEPFFTANRTPIIHYLRDNPECLLCMFRDPGMPMRYFQLQICTEAQPNTDPQYKPGHFFHGFSSGVAAVQMAMQAGCDPIYLLGQDCGVSNGMTHGFGVRGQDELSKGYPQGQMMLPAYKVLAKHAAQLGVSIVNLSQTSAIQDFPRATLESLC